MFSISRYNRRRKNINPVRELASHIERPFRDPFSKLNNDICSFFYFAKLCNLLLPPPEFKFSINMKEVNNQFRICLTRIYEIDQEDYLDEGEDAFRDIRRRLPVRPNVCKSQLKRPYLHGLILVHRELISELEIIKYRKLNSNYNETTKINWRSLWLLHQSWERAPRKQQNRNRNKK